MIHKRSTALEQAVNCFAVGMFYKIVSQIYPSELQLNKANTSATEAAF